MIPSNRFYCFLAVFMHRLYPLFVLAHSSFPRGILERTCVTHHEYGSLSFFKLMSARQRRRNLSYRQWILEASRAHENNVLFFLIPRSSSPLLVHRCRHSRLTSIFWPRTQHMLLLLNFMQSLRGVKPAKSTHRYHESSFLAGAGTPSSGAPLSLFYFSGAQVRPWMVLSVVSRAKTVHAYTLLS